MGYYRGSSILLDCVAVLVVSLSLRIFPGVHRSCWFDWIFLVVSLSSRLCQGFINLAGLRSFWWFPCHQGLFKGLIDLAGLCSFLVVSLLSRVIPGVHRSCWFV